MIRETRVRHITCPLCDKGFTEILDPPVYEVEGRDGLWSKAICPKCGTEVYVKDKECVYDVESKMVGIVLDTGMWIG